MTTLSTTIRLPHVERGDPAGVPVLMLHGWSDSWRSFEPVMPHLPADLRAIAVTQRGHGEADRPATGYTPRDYAADALALLDALEIESCVVVGHSMGAWVAERIAADHPGRVRGVVLAGAIGPVQANPVMDELVQVAGGFEGPVAPDFVREFQLGTTERPLPAGQIDLFVAESLKLPARVWRASGAGFPRDGVYATAEAIAAPALLIWGDRDAVASRSEQDQFVATLPQARLAVYEGTGHAVHWEEPERFAADVAAFAAEVAR